MKLKPFFLIVGTVFAFMLAGCLTTPEPNEPLRVELLFEVDEMGETFERGDDSINITQLKFTIDRFNLIAEDSSLVLESGEEFDSIIFNYSEEFTDKNLVLGVQLGFEDVSAFEGYEMFVRPVTQFDSINDQDFFGSENNYSFIVKGEYNGEEFTYNSSLSFDKFQELGTVQVGQKRETLVIDKMVVISDLFVDESEQRIINPTDPENESLINSRFIENLLIEGYSLFRFTDTE